MGEAVRNEAPDFIRAGNVKEFSLSQKASVWHLCALNKRPRLNVTNLNVP
jgi:hypothetical protein